MRLKALHSAILINIFMFSLVAAGQNSQKFTVSGYVTDIGSGESLIGAGVLSSGEAKTGVSTNEFGWYNVSLREGRTTIEYHYVGYEPRTISFDLNKDTVINVTLSPSTTLSEAVVVARNNAGIRSTNMSALDVPISQVIKSPTLFGESDIIKFLQMLPGVQGGMEGTTGIHVRGGSQDENLVMLDGIPIYNIDHVLGIFSVFTPEAVKKVTFYKGAFPARYGGRISSIVDVRTNGWQSKRDPRRGERRDADQQGSRRGAAEAGQDIFFSEFQRDAYSVLPAFHKIGDERRGQGKLLFLRCQCEVLS